MSIISHQDKSNVCAINKEENNMNQPREMILDLFKIRLDGGTQLRVNIDKEHINRLSDHLQEGQELNPITVFFDGSSYWLVDGFHRWHAHLACRLEQIRCEVIQGTKRDAILFAVGANAHQKTMLARKSADKQNAVLTLLKDPEWRLWSDSQIARQCQVNQSTVSRIRAKLGHKQGELKERFFVNKHGKISKMNVVNIGQKKVKEKKQQQDTKDKKIQQTIISTIKNPSRGNLNIAETIKNFKTSEEDIFNRQNDQHSNQLLSIPSSFAQMHLQSEAICQIFINLAAYLKEQDALSIIKAIERYHPEIVTKLCNKGNKNK